MFDYGLALDDELHRLVRYEAFLRITSMVGTRFTYIQ